MEDESNCAVADCLNPAKTRGWCHKHYVRWWKHGDPLIVQLAGWGNRPRQHQTCSVDDCATRPLARGWCRKHYKRWQATGDPTLTLPTGRPELGVCQRSHEPNWYVYEQGRRVNRTCRTCRNERRFSPEGIAEHRDRELQRLYGISSAEVDALLTSQGGVCAICARSPEPPHVDHDHQTGAIRGILCNSCNLAIGMLQDSPDIVQAALTYLTHDGPRQLSTAR